MQILQISPFFRTKLGGTERFSIQLSLNLSKRHDVHIFTSKLNPLDKSIEKINGITIHRFFAPKVVWNINPICFMLHKILKYNFNLIHAHSHIYLTTLQGIFGAQLKKTPLILQVHGGLNIPPPSIVGATKSVSKRIYDKFIGNYCFKMATSILVMCQYEKDILTQRFQVPESKISIMGSAVDTKTFHPGNSTPPENKILYVGDLERWKGIDYLIKAWKQIYKRYPSSKFIVVGDGSEKTKIIQQRSKLPIEYLGQKKHEEIAKIMRYSTILVLPSLMEGLPNVLLEALASGIPVIATNVGGIPEIIQNEKTGLLIRPKNVQDLISSLSYLIEEENLRNTLSKNGLQFIKQNFSWDSLVNKIETIYNHIQNNQKIY